MSQAGPSAGRASSRATSSAGVAVSLLAALACGGCFESKPHFAAPVVLSGREVSADVLNRGHRTYSLYCASCHGADGSGQGNAARSLQTAPRDFRAAEFKYKSTPGDALPTDEDLANTILRGRIETGMPAWNGLAPEDRDAVIQYIKTFSPRWQQAPSESPAAAAAASSETPSES